MITQKYSIPIDNPHNREAVGGLVFRCDADDKVTGFISHYDRDTKRATITLFRSQDVPDAIFLNWAVHISKSITDKELKDDIQTASRHEHSPLKSLLKRQREAQSDAITGKCLICSTPRDGSDKYWCQACAKKQANEHIKEP